VVSKLKPQPVPNYLIQSRFGESGLIRLSAFSQTIVLAKSSGFVGQSQASPSCLFEDAITIKPCNGNLGLTVGYHPGPDVNSSQSAQVRTNVSPFSTHMALHSIPCSFLNTSRIPSYPAMAIEVTVLVTGLTKSALVMFLYFSFFHINPCDGSYIKAYGLNGFLRFGSSCGNFIPGLIPVISPNKFGLR
jgi:hypothetical protein